MEKSSFVDFLTCPSVLSAVFVGGCVLLLSYILKSFRNDDAEQRDQSEPSSSTVEKKKESAALKQKKKQNWTRSTDQTFANPWLLKTLKNHTGQVLNIDYSSSGKYLASCGEEEPDPDPDMNSSSGSECNKENSRPPSAEPSPSTKGLSRRQRKNRRREDSSPDSKKNKEPKREPLAHCVNLNVPERVFVALLHPHLLTYDQLFVGGYPVQSPAHNNAVVFFNNNNTFSRPKFDVNAREFVPSRAAASDTSDSDESSGSEPDASFYADEKAANLGVEHACVRCGRGLFIAHEDYLTQERCVYHWGKLHSDRSTGAASYTCCGGRPDSMGCTTCKLHVWNGVKAGLNVPCEGYVKTRQRKTAPADGNYGVYALDCEMCYTMAGLELTRVTVVAVDGRLVYDSFVRPQNEIIDYNTRFSGITAKDLASNAKTLKEVQNDLRGFINADTILIGHALENDLRALKLVHKTVVDTALSFPHFNGLPYRRSLKQLVSSYLHREVQCGSNGHNSYEDAYACMELMKYRVGNENRSCMMM